MAYMDDSQNSEQDAGPAMKGLEEPPAAALSGSNEGED